MKSNAGCWTPPATTLLIAMLLLTGSRMGSFDRQAHCLPVVEYSAADQRRAADEIEALFEIGVVVRMTARLCRAAGSSADMQMSLGSGKCRAGSASRLDLSALPSSFHRFRVSRSRSDRLPVLDGTRHDALSQMQMRTIAHRSPPLGNGGFVVPAFRTGRRTGLLRCRAALAGSRNGCRWVNIVAQPRVSSPLSAFYAMPKPIPAA